MAKLTIIYWRDIPAQIIGQQGRKRTRKELSPRFAKAIDRAAMRAGKGSSNAYLEEWRRESRPVEGAADAAAEAEAAKLEARFTDELLEATVKNGGLVKEGTQS
jgi:hypothetical protein